MLQVQVGAPEALQEEGRGRDEEPGFACTLPDWLGGCVCDPVCAMAALWRGIAAWFLNAVPLAGGALALAQAHAIGLSPLDQRMPRAVKKLSSCPHANARWPHCATAL